MVNNQNGFAYPLSLCLLLLVSSFTVIHTQQYLSEKALIHETETILKQEYYYLFSIKKLETQLVNNEPIQTRGSYILSDGKMDYVKEDLGTSFKFTFTLTLNTGEKAIGMAYYNKSLKKMIKWVEKN